MPTEFLREIQGPAGPLEALLDEPSGSSAEGIAPFDSLALAQGRQGRPRAVAVFAHPHPLHGGTMHTKVVYQAAKALARVGVPVLRFNFRGVGRSAGTFDGGPGEMDDFRAGLAFMEGRYPGVPLWAAGFSFGSWVALSTGADDPRVQLLLAIAPPVDRYDFDVVKRSQKPKFIIHGEFDELVPLKDVRLFYAELPEPKEMIVIDAADHLFDGQTVEVGEAIENLVAGEVQG
jgi:uncharacterized protein